MVVNVIEKIKCESGKVRRTVANGFMGRDLELCSYSLIMNGINMVAQQMGRKIACVVGGINLVCRLLKK